MCMAQVPVGYEIKKYGLILRITKYERDRAWGECSGCGVVTPALRIYNERTLTKWLDTHVNLFPKKHGIQDVEIK